MNMKCNIIIKHELGHKCLFMRLLDDKCFYLDELYLLCLWLKSSHLKLVKLNEY